MSKRNRAVAMASAVLLVAGGAVTAMAPAANAADYHGIDGNSYVYDDWQDEENLGVDDYAQSNATALWETVLWADGAMYEDEDGDWHPFKKNKIDGSFGPETESATQWWQNHYGIPENDGVVTDDCWLSAQSRLHGPYASSNVQYSGSARTVTFKRVSGKYRVKLKGTGSWKIAYYDKVG
ncbi:peptidoglycan-binding protein [Streptomyces sp. NBC_01352]|uniref:peptidoglycan-binding domain-containing protein n=1 Tax=unclassified Streptomyces TaxID=2593676 RepID=UPI002256641B|nr:MULTISPECIES: peptidoglycan-binding domain-containing protein [unclassified Streptomyces]MCX4704445.1 peptidoglycan-binding protein [Streptomyces sp. NBC_01373]